MDNIYMRNKNINNNINNKLIIKNNNKMKNKLKINKTTSILKLNNNIYIPFQLHTLPNYFNKINPKYIIKYKSLIYINKTQIKNKNIIDLLNHSKLNKFSLK